MAWGDNEEGQLGNDTTTDETEPVEVKRITEATAVAGGEYHSLALLKSGKVMAWGENDDGQLGNGTTTKEKEPVEVKGITEAVGIAAGYDFSLAVLKSGKVMTWGENDDGQLGNGTATKATKPVEVKGITKAAAVAGGEFHSLALLESGKVEAWGENDDGQLGNDTTTKAKEPVEVKGLNGAAGGVAAGADFGVASYAGKLPVNTTIPSISGEAEDEKELTASRGVWTGTPTITYLFQWEHCEAKGCEDIAGAESESYVIQHAQVGQTVRVKVTAKNGVGETAAASAQTATVLASPPTNTAVPVISGEAKDEQTLSASHGSWKGTPTIAYKYQWEHCEAKGCEDIAGAEGESYVIGHAQVGQTVRVKVTAKNGVGETAAASAQTATVLASPPTNTAVPVISGEARDEQTLSASSGSWKGTPTISYSYRWESCTGEPLRCETLDGATSQTYRLEGENIGTILRVTVTAKNSSGASSASSGVAGVILPSTPFDAVQPTILGAAVEGKTVEVARGEWEGAGGFSYQWETCNALGEGCMPVPGATGSTYLMGPGAVGGTLAVVVTASSAAGSSEATSPATPVVERGPFYYVSQLPRVGSDVTLGGPNDVAVSAGDVWVAAYEGVEELAANGELVRRLGEASGPGHLEHPTSIAVNAEERVFVAESTADRVDVYSSTGEYLWSIGEAGHVSGELEHPDGVAVGPGGTIWVADSGNHRLEQFTEDGEYVRTIEGEGSAELRNCPKTFHVACRRWWRRRYQRRAQASWMRPR
jgi:hypothetical protein